MSRVCSLAKALVPRSLRGAGILVGVLASGAGAQAADGYAHGCYVPNTGTVYRILEPNTPTACRPGHVEFRWLKTPLQVNSNAAALIVGNAGTGSAIIGTAVSTYAVSGLTSSPGNVAGVLGTGQQMGVQGVALNTSVGWGVKGSARGTAVGVEGLSANGAGVRGNALDCDNSGCVPTAGDGGQFLAGVGGTLVHGFLNNGADGWVEKFRVGADGSGLFTGDLTVQGSASKPGGGSWATLSDLRTKTGIEPLPNALDRLLQLRGVTFEFSNPDQFHELPGRHIGMIAQEVEKVFPSWVDTGADGLKRITFRGFEGVTVEAIRELDTRLTKTSQATADRLNSLELENARLKQEIEQLIQAIKTLQGRQ